MKDFLYTRDDGSGRVFKKYYGDYTQSPAWGGYIKKAGEIPRIKTTVGFPYKTQGEVLPMSQESYRKRESGYQNSTQKYVTGNIGVGFSNQYYFKPVQETYVRGLGYVSRQSTSQYPLYSQGKFESSSKDYAYTMGRPKNVSQMAPGYGNLVDKGAAINRLASDKNNIEGSNIRKLMNVNSTEKYKPRVSNYSQINRNVQSMEAQGMYKSKYGPTKDYTGTMYVN